jgi:hypothetical protein
MYNSNIPNDRELPSTKKLVKSTILAAAGAGVLLITVVMPAEYGIDPTGLGQVTGLKQMGEIKMSLAQEAAREIPQETAMQQISPEDVNKFASAAKPLAEVAKAQASQPVESVVFLEKPEPVDSKLRKDEMTFTLAPNEAAEIKAVLQKGKKVSYEWSSSGKVNFDNHGDSKNLNIKYHGYSKGVSQLRDTGVIEAAFDGKHGWFWRNRTKEKVTVTLATSGEYSELVRVD